MSALRLAIVEIAVDDECEWLCGQRCAYSEGPWCSIFVVMQRRDARVSLRRPGGDFMRTPECVVATTLAQSLPQSNRADERKTEK